MVELKIDPEFRDKIPPLTVEEFEQLRENILADGEVYEPIATWNNVIVDGHNRWRIIQENPKIPFRTKEMNFENKWEAFDWMYRKQLGRRNLSDEQKTYMIGKMYEARKNSYGGDRKSSSQSGNMKSEPRGRIGEIIAKELGVGHGTVTRAADFAKGVDEMSKESPEAAKKILDGKSGATQADVRSFPTMAPEAKSEFISDVVSGAIKDKRKGNWANSETRNRYAKIRDIAEQMGAKQSGTTFDDVLRMLDAAENDFISKIERMIESERNNITADDRWPNAIDGYFDSVISDINDLKGRIIK